MTAQERWCGAGGPFAIGLRATAGASCWPSKAAAAACLMHAPGCLAPNLVPLSEAGHKRHMLDMVMVCLLRHLRYFSMRLGHSMQSVRMQQAEGAISQYRRGELVKLVNSNRSGGNDVRVCTRKDQMHLLPSCVCVLGLGSAWLCARPLDLLLGLKNTGEPTLTSLAFLHPE